MDQKSVDALAGDLRDINDKLLQYYVEQNLSEDYLESFNAYCETVANAIESITPGFDKSQFLKKVQF